MKDFTDFIIKNKEIKVTDVTKMLLTEATVDFPRAGLDPMVWNKVEGGDYVLRGDVKDMIMDYIQSYPGKENLMELIDELHVVGSIGTNLYTDDADIDVHIVPKFDMLPDSQEQREEFRDEVKKWSHENPIYVGEHPMELYIQLMPEQELMGDATYDVMEDIWKKGPRIEKLDYNPYEVFKGVLDNVRNLAQKADVDLGELKRDIIDFETVREAMSKLPLEYKNMLKDELDNKLQEIEDDISSLLKDKKEWVDMRHKSSTPLSKEQALSDIELAKQWNDANAMFKFLNRYKYIRIITELEELMKDDEIDANEIGIIRSVLGMGSGQ